MSYQKELQPQEICAWRCERFCSGIGIGVGFLIPSAFVVFGGWGVSPTRDAPIMVSPSRRLKARQGVHSGREQLSQIGNFS